MAYNHDADEYLVAVRGKIAPQDDLEIWIERLDASDLSYISGPTAISRMGPPDDQQYGADQPDVAYDPAGNTYLVVWRGDDDEHGFVQGEYEIWGQQLDAAGNEIGVDDMVISEAGGTGDPAFDAGDPAYGASDASVAYDATKGQYLVAWGADEDEAPLFDNHREIFAQSLDGSGAELGGTRAPEILTAEPDGAFEGARHQTRGADASCSRRSSIGSRTFLLEREREEAERTRRLAAVETDDGEG